MTIDKMENKIEDKLIHFKLGNSTRNILISLFLVGLVSLVVTFITMSEEPTRHMIEGKRFGSNVAWSSFLVGAVLFIGLALSGIFATAISYISGSHWSVSSRRITECFGSVIPVSLIFFVILFFGIHDLYEWSHTEVVEKDHILKHKQPLLNTPFFMIRLFVYGIVWSVFSYLFYKRSTKQDEDKKMIHTDFNTRLSAGFLIFFALSVSIASFDLIMSLTPHWFSTMFGIYIFAGFYQSGLAAFIITIAFLKKKGYIGNLINENHVHDYGKYLFGFCTFWAYVGFCQFMLIWYAGIPEETFFYEQRLIGGWEYFTLSLPFLKFVLPFLLLLNRPNKRNISFISKVCYWVIFTQFLELFWLIFPSNFETFNFISFISAFLFSVGILGIFSFLVLKRLEKKPLIPVGDPRLEASLKHHV